MICIDKQLPPAPGYRAISPKGKSWKVGEVIRISFIGGTADERLKVKQWGSEWLKYANVVFQWDQLKSDVRISFQRGIGSWSYIGTDALAVRPTEATMNFGWLDRQTVLHEFGHMLGLAHEHQNPQGGIQWNIDQVVKDLSGPPNNWDNATIFHNVINKYNTSSVNGTTFDPKSIMLYFFPARWTQNGMSSSINNDISEQDAAFIAAMYPKEDSRNLKEVLLDIFKTQKNLERLPNDNNTTKRNKYTGYGLASL